MLPEKSVFTTNCLAAVSPLSNICNYHFYQTTSFTTVLLASCLIYARAFVEYIYVGAFCFKMLPSVKFAEDKVLTFLILREIAKIVQP